MERALTFKKQRDGRLLALIDGLPCYTPPVPTSPEGFLNGHLTERKQQKWMRQGVYPTEEEIAALSEEQRDQLRAREAERLVEGGGAWFLNDGEPTYLTPDHYFFLVHFKLPELDYPVFYEADAKDFLWNTGVEDDEYCIGGVMMGARQRGKTARRACRLLRKAMTTPGVLLGIQSKTDDAARDVLNIFISHALREMSDLIRPVTSLTTDDAQTEIAFKAPAKRGRAGQGGEKVRALNSRINRKNSKATAYDSKTVYELLSDEWAKKQEYDTEERLTVVSRMMWSRSGKRKGRIWMYSTIDEKEDFEPEMPMRVWAGSDTRERLPSGRTKTGLVRLFISCLEASVVDAYGRSLLKESLVQWETNAPDKDSDPIAYRRYCRANPRTPEDGFASANRDSTFNLDALDAARDANTTQFHRAKRYHWGLYNLEWEDPDERSRVKYVPASNGRFKIVVKALPTELNAVMAAGQHSSILGTFTKYKPLHEARNVCGSDPYNARKVRDLGAASKGAAYAFWKPDELHERERFVPGTQVEQPAYWPSDSFFIEYINRPPSPHIFFEDMVKLCHLLGAPMLIENNKDALVAYFEDRGYFDFIRGRTSIVASINVKEDRKRKRDETPGMAASADTTEQWAERIADFTHGPLVLDYRRMPFNHQIQDITNLNLKKTKEYDAAVATGWTLLLARRYRRPAAPPLPRGALQVHGLFNFESV